MIPTTKAKGKSFFFGWHFLGMLLICMCIDFEKDRLSSHHSHPTVAVECEGSEQGKDTRRKINTEPENDGLEDDFPFRKDAFSGSMLYYHRLNHHFERMLFYST